MKEIKAKSILVRVSEGSSYRDCRLSTPFHKQFKVFFGTV